jgi:hypothetical protein
MFLTHIWEIMFSSSDSGLLKSSNLNMQLLECIQDNVCTWNSLPEIKQKKWFYKHPQIKSYSLYVDIWEAYEAWYLFTIH